MSFGLFCGVVATAQVPPSPPPAGAPQAPVAPGPGRGGRGGPAVVSPQIEADGRVTFRVLAPNATTVTVGGDISGSMVPDPNAPPPTPAAAGLAGAEAVARRLSR